MSEVKSFENKWGDRIELHEKHVKIIIAGWGGWFPPSDKPIGSKTTRAGEYKFPYSGINVIYEKKRMGIGFLTIIKESERQESTYIWHNRETFGWEKIPLLIKNMKQKEQASIYGKNAFLAEKNLDYDEALRFYELALMNDEAKRIRKIISLPKDLEKAKKHEKLLEFDEAAEIYKELGMDEEVIRVRKLKAEQGAVKVSQKVVHGDEVTKTEIKDSVLNRSNVGGGSSKMQELKDLTEMKKEGLIDDDEFKQMKKEILGK